MVASRVREYFLISRDFITVIIDGLSFASSQVADLIY